MNIFMNGTAVSVSSTIVTSFVEHLCAPLVWFSPLWKQIKMNTIQENVFFFLKNKKSAVI